MMQKSNHSIKSTLLLVVTLVVSQLSAQTLKPYILASKSNGDLKTVMTETKAKLTSAGFTIVGHTSPTSSVTVLAITHDELKKNAAKSTHGGFGAVQRVSITKKGATVQVAYTNPAYWAAAYRMSGSHAGITSKLEASLGKGTPFGSEKGITKEKLAKYHYMAMMPYFTDIDEIGEATTHEEALKKVEAGLAAQKGGVQKIYKVVIPGKKEVVYGVALSVKDGADANVLAIADQANLSHSAYLPYELLVTGNKILALRGKFRIAISFPDLTMGTFMKIVGAPSDIQNALEAVAGNE